ncbi:hypothetical protein [Nonlabens xiamenensis]|uniref:hypothetical protein n=1 Tax=Nonlabens xiamenensis TaxID=2341043 RepID=UPI000F60A5DA|nr:hypothetical protein [Nonlabens xiamenensis]
MKYLIALACLALISCNSQKISATKKAENYNLNERPYAQEWLGGAPGSGSGIDLYLPASLILNAELQAVYFRNMTSTQLRFTNNIKNMTVTRFNQPINKDLVMDIDQQKEMQNTPPEALDFPFPLEDDEAVVEVKRDGKSEYIKVTGIEYKEPIAYPEMRPEK